MKIIFIIVVLMCGAGVGLYFYELNQVDDSAAIRKYVETRGESPVPRSWRGKVGDGI